MSPEAIYALCAIGASIAFIVAIILPEIPRR